MQASAFVPGVNMTIKGVVADQGRQTSLQVGVHRVNDQKYTELKGKIVEAFFITKIQPEKEMCCI